jgi:hypothetical protein
LKKHNKLGDEDLFLEDEQAEKEAGTETDLKNEKEGFDVAQENIEESLEEHREKEQKAWDDDEEEEII